MQYVTYSPRLSDLSWIARGKVKMVLLTLVVLHVGLERNMLPQEKEKALPRLKGKGTPNFTIGIGIGSRSLPESLIHRARIATLLTTHP